MYTNFTVTVEINVVILQGDGNQSISRSWAYKQMMLYPITETLVQTCLLLLYFFTVRSWKQTRCLPPDEWIKELQSIYSVEYCLDNTKNETIKIFR